MTQGIDGIEKIILANSPETNKPTLYQCIGYANLTGHGLEDQYKSPSDQKPYALRHLEEHARNEGQIIKVYALSKQYIPEKLSMPLFEQAERIKTK